MNPQVPPCYYRYPFALEMWLLSGGVSLFKMCYYSAKLMYGSRGPILGDSRSRGTTYSF